MKAQDTTEELSYLRNFSESIIFALGMAQQGLSDFVLVTMANLNLSWHDSYLGHLKSDIKHDTLGNAAL